MKLSKEQIEVLDRSLSHPYGSGVKLLCDGFVVSLRVERVTPMRYRVITYVNGQFKGAWCNSSNEQPEQKFLRKLVKPICSPSIKRRAEKMMGKRAVKNDPFYSQTMTSYMPDWASGKAALNHLNRVCESIQLAE
jgi:hypothetical protein